MAYTDLLNLKQCSLGYASQSDIVTPAGGSYTWLDAHDISVTPEAPTAKPGRTVSTRGSAPLNTSGRAWYRIAFKTYAHGQAAAYNFASDSPALVGMWGLLTGHFATAAGAYHATGVNPSDGNTLSLTNNPLLGSLIAFANSSNVVGGMGFLKSKSGGGPYTAELFEDLVAQPGASNKQVPTLTLYPTVGKQILSLRITGEPSAQDKRFYGAILQKVDFAFDEADNLLLEWEFVAYGGKTDRGGAGGLQTIADYLSLEPYVGAGNGRVVLGSNVFSGFADGTVDADGHCDVRDIRISHSLTHRVVSAPWLAEGVKDVQLFNPMTSVSFSVPDVTDLDVSSVNAFEKAFRDKTQVSFSLYMGDTPGRLVAHQIPRGQVTAFPGYPEVDGAVARAITIEAVDYAGDGASTDAGNKPSRIAIG